MCIKCFNGILFKSCGKDHQRRIVHQFQHFKAIAQATKLPIMLYSIPGRCGIEIGLDVLVRLAPYGPRLARTCQRVVEGETNMFTGVMCGSYHDVWMELHEDLILTQGIDRSAEGSF